MLLPVHFCSNNLVMKGAMFCTENFKEVPVRRSLLKNAAFFRTAYTSLRLPDAIHLATALSGHHTVFLANGIRPKVYDNLRFLLLKE